MSLVIGDSGEGAGASKRVLTYDLSYVLLGIVLPQLANLFLAGEIFFFLAGTFDICLCSGIAKESAGQTIGTSQDHVLFGRRMCVYALNSTTTTTVDLTSVTNVYDCDTRGAKSDSARIVVIAYSAVGTVIVCLLSLVLVLKKLHWAALLASFVSVTCEWVSLFIIISEVTRDDFRSSSSLFLLQMNVLFSSVFCFILNMVDGADAQVLTAMGLAPGKKHRLPILFAFQFVYALAITINLVTLASRPPYDLS